MGSFGAILLATEHADQLDGIILTPPYLGRRDSIKAIIDSGGLKLWDPAGSPMQDHVVKVYTWIRDSTARILLGFGESDRLVLVYQPLLSETLPASAFHTSSGGHNWATWERIAANCQTPRFECPQ
jgi:hypothetical protein